MDCPVGLYQRNRVVPLAGSYGDLHILSGAFSPLTNKHRELYKRIDPDGTLEDEYSSGSSAICSIPPYVAFEVSYRMVGKPPLSNSAMLQRLEPFWGYAPVLVTDAPRFIEKAEALNVHCSRLVFHVGSHTFGTLLSSEGKEGVEAIPALFVVWPHEGSTPYSLPSNCSMDHH